MSALNICRIVPALPYTTLARGCQWLSLQQPVPLHHETHAQYTWMMRPAVFLQALATFGDEIGIAFSGAEDVALVEYAHLTGRPFRVFRCSH